MTNLYYYQDIIKGNYTTKRKGAPLGAPNIELEDTSSKVLLDFVAREMRLESIVAFVAGSSCVDGVQAHHVDALDNAIEFVCSQIREDLLALTNDSQLLNFEFRDCKV